MIKTKRILFLLLAVALLTGCMGLRPTGWVERRGALRYYDDQGKMVTGWLFCEDGTYYLHEDGTRSTGWQQIDGAHYFFTDDGRMHTGWLEEADGKRLLGADGAQVFGLVTDGGHTYFLDDSGRPATGWQQAGGKTYYMDENGRAVSGMVAIGDTVYAFDARGALATGRYEWEGTTYCIGADGTPLTGWQEMDGKACYLNGDGSVYNGWLEDDGHTYYFQDGGYTTGIKVIDGQKCFFDSRGWQLLMVNPWNPMPEGYEPVLADIGGGYALAAETYEDFNAMMAACREAGHAPFVTSAYRTMQKQESLFANKTRQYLNQGYSEEEARAHAGTSVAIPGTSEHQLGLAVDIIDAVYPHLDEGQEETPAQQWLIAHSWEYGFILRYPNGKSEITGIIYEPWHYRYVGRPLAAELFETGLTLEEYLQALTTE